MRRRLGRRRHDGAALGLARDQLEQQSRRYATALDELYGHGIGIPAYALTGLIGLQRLDSGAHDSGAVLFGWVLGYVVGHTVAAKAAPRVLGLQVGLYQDPDSGALGLSLYGGL